jgi:hypothetical protein
MAIETSVVIDDRNVRRLVNGLIKNVGQISARGKKYVGLLSSVVIRDVIDHFAKQQGPEGRWKAWSTNYRRFMISKGKGGNLILTDTGRLRQGWQPARYRLVKDGILWFNPVSYAAQHDEGRSPYPQRKFTWISDRAIKEIEQQTVKFIEDV